MMDAYEEYYETAQRTLVEGATAEDVHRAVAPILSRRGWQLGHITGHSIGMTMIEHPRIGEGSRVELRENMVLSMHPHVLSEDATSCLYMQDTYRVGPRTAASRSPRCRCGSTEAARRRDTSLTRPGTVS
jgi:Xaa-Pro aminopeptidase